MTEPARLSDAQAIAKLDSNNRKAIKDYGLVRCLVEPNAWHRARPKTPPDYGNSPVPHFQPCLCRSK